MTVERGRHRRRHDRAGSHPPTDQGAGGQRGGRGHRRRPGPRAGAWPRASRAPRAHATGQELIARRRGRRRGRHLLGADPRGVRPRLHRGRQAGLLREAAGDDAGGLPAHPGGRDGVRPAAGAGRLHAPLRPGLPRAEGDRGQRRHRRAADDALRRTATRTVPGALHQRHGDQRHDGARRRHRPLAARRRGRRRPRCWRRAATAAPASCAIRCSCCSRWRSGAIVDVEVSVNIAYGYDIRGEIVGRDRHGELAESNPVVVKREGAFGGRVPEPTGASGSCAPSTSSSRNGSTPSRRAPPPAPAPGTATPRRPSATPRSRRCAPAPGRKVSLRERPELLCFSLIETLMAFPSSLPRPRTLDPATVPTLRWGVLGPGWIAERFVPSVQRHTRQEIVAVGGRDPAKT